jgi:hypothetical protein
MPTSARSTAFSAPYSLSYDPSNDPERVPWPSAFAHNVNVDLGAIRSRMMTSSSPHNRIVENVDRVGQQARRMNNKWQPSTTRCFIAVLLAVVLVAAALIGAMVAISKSTKHRTSLDTLLLDGGLMPTTPLFDPRTTWLPTSTTTNASKDLTESRSAISPQKSPITYSKSALVGSDPSSSSAETK